MNEPEARAGVESYKQKSIEAIKLLGEIESLPADFGDRIETCNSDLDGSYLGSGKVVSNSSWNVEQDGSAGFDTVEDALAEDSMEVTPYDPGTEALSAEADGFKVIISFWEAEGTSGRVDLTVQSSCVDGIDGIS